MQPSLPWLLQLLGVPVVLLRMMVLVLVASLAQLLPAVMAKGLQQMTVMWRLACRCLSSVRISPRRHCWLRRSSCWGKAQLPAASSSHLQTSSSKHTRPARQEMQPSLRWLVQLLGVQKLLWPSVRSIRSWP